MLGELSFPCYLGWKASNNSSLSIVALTLVNQEPSEPGEPGSLASRARATFRESKFDNQFTNYLVDGQIS